MHWNYDYDFGAPFWRRGRTTHRQQRSHHNQVQHAAMFLRKPCHQGRSLHAILVTCACWSPGAARLFKTVCLPVRVREETRTITVLAVAAMPCMIVHAMPKRRDKTKHLSLSSARQCFNFHPVYPMYHRVSCVSIPGIFLGIWATPCRQYTWGPKSGYTG